MFENRNEIRKNRKIASQVALIIGHFVYNMAMSTVSIRFGMWNGIRDLSKDVSGRTI